MQDERAALEPVLDIHSALARLDGDEQLLVDLMGFLLEDAPRLLGQLRDAADCNDVGRVKLAAHSLKGLIAGCGGVRAAEAAKCVEQAALPGSLARIHEADPAVGGRT